MRIELFFKKKVKKVKKNVECNENGDVEEGNVFFWLNGELVDLSFINEIVWKDGVFLKIGVEIFIVEVNLLIVKFLLFFENIMLGFFVMFYFELEFGGK